MDFKLFNFLPENWFHALVTMLFHSLWMGIVLALLSGLVVFCTRKSSAVMRYNLLSLCLVLFVFAVSFVFYKALGLPVSNQTAVALKHTVEGRTNSNLQPESVSDLQIQFSNFLGRLLSLWNQYAYQIVLIWFVVICFKSIQLLIGLKGIQHLRNYKTFKAGNNWDKKLLHLSRQLGIQQEIKLMQSGIARVPMVLGHFKPLILLPLGLLNGLSETEAEAILAHELAHIKRRDYLVNLLQNFIEIIFFFNPAVLWVSNLIKTEREHCCDDLAIACVNDRKNYVQALIFCQEYTQRAPAYAMAITGGKNSLLRRASRMLFNTKSTLNKMEKTILTIALVSVVLCTAAFRNTSQAGTKQNPEKTLLVQSVPGTSKKKVKAEPVKSVFSPKEKPLNRTTTKPDQIFKSSDQLEAEIQQKINRAEKALTTSEKALSNEEAQLAREDRKNNIEEAKWKTEDDKWAAEDKKRALEDKKATQSKRRMRAELKRAYQTGDAVDERVYRSAVESYSATNRSSARGYGISSTNRIPASPPVPPTPAYDGITPPTPPTPPAYSISSSTTNVNRNSRRAFTTTGRGRSESVFTTNNNENQDNNPIYKELLKDGLIKTSNTLSYKLNPDELIVNGVKQSDEVHEKYKKAFLKTAKHSIYYNYESSTKNN